MIELHNLTKVYDLGEDKIQALRGINLEVFPGEVVVLMGPSGSGKSTLMNILGCLDKPTSGQFQFLGRDVASLSDDEMAHLRNHEIGFVFQNFNLLARTTAVENVELPMLYDGAAPPVRHHRAKELLGLVGLAERSDHFPTKLSGGQQQRVAIARALLNEPRLILADEPTGNLDTKTGTEILDLFQRLNREKGITVVLVTHDPRVATIGHRVIHFLDGLIEDEEKNGAGLNERVSLISKNDSSTRNKQLISELKTDLGIATKALKVNKLRSALTMLGVIIGVAAVIAMVAIGEGTKQRIAAQMERLGSNRLTVYSGAGRRGGRSWGNDSVTTLTAADGREIAANVQGVTAVAPVVRGRAQTVYGNKNWLPSITGTTPEFFQIMGWDLEDGRPFTQEDMMTNRKVAIIGKTVMKELFGERAPAGETIRVKRIPFEVIGVLKERGSSSFMGDLDDIVILPFKVAQRRLLGIHHVNNIEIGIVSQEAANQITEDMNALLRRRHKITPAKGDDFTVRNRQEIVDAAREASTTMSQLLAGIALVALIVGGIGIMNIMLVSVKERTREIGLRLAIGARRRDLRRQFLTEAMVLSLLGGVLGILLGIAAAYTLSSLGQWDTLVSPGAIFLAFGFSAAIGIFFGYHPASQASKLDPIEALRYE